MPLLPPLALPLALPRSQLECVMPPDYVSRFLPAPKGAFYLGTDNYHRGATKALPVPLAPHPEPHPVCHPPSPTADEGQCARRTCDYQPAKNCVAVLPLPPH